MPLVGVLSEDKQDYGTPYTFAEYIHLLKTDQRRSHYPIEMFVAMSRNHEERKDAGLSATTILDCPRFVVLARDHDYYEWPSKYWWRFRGTIGHLIVELYDEGDEDVIRETRFKRSTLIDGVPIEVTGKMDKINTRTRFLLDYKSINEVPAEPKYSHEEQINIYRWLLADGVRMDTNERVQLEIERAGIQYFDMSTAKKYGVECWPMAKCEAFVNERVRPFAHHRTTKVLPPILTNVFGTRAMECKNCPLREVCDARAA